MLRTLCGMNYSNDPFACFCVSFLIYLAPKQSHLNISGSGFCESCQIAFTGGKCSHLSKSLILLTCLIITMFTVLHGKDPRHASETRKRIKNSIIYYLVSFTVASQLWHISLKLRPSSLSYSFNRLSEHICYFPCAENAKITYHCPRALL